MNQRINLNEKVKLNNQANSSPKEMKNKLNIS
jgi:hypothetical protein